MKERYKRTLPHIQPIGACFCVTFRLFGSLPKKVLDKLKSDNEEELMALNEIVDEREKNYKVFNLRKKLFEESDSYLDLCKNGPHHLENDEVKSIIRKELMRFDKHLYDILAFSIMSNHVHILIDTSIQVEKKEQKELNETYIQLDKIMKKIKGPTAIYCNRILGLKGKFWARESFDMYIRNEKMLNNVIKYILNNPVKAGLVNNWQDYAGNYLKLATAK